MDSHKYGPWALIAGASEGIGEHAARQLAAHGLSLVLVSRRIDVLDALRESILADSPGVEVRCLAIALGDGDAADRLVRDTADLEIGLLFYNAGADTGPEKLVDRDPAQVLSMVRR